MGLHSAIKMLQQQLVTLQQLVARVNSGAGGGRGSGRVVGPRGCILGGGAAVGSPRAAATGPAARPDASRTSPAPGAGEVAYPHALARQINALVHSLPALASTGFSQDFLLVWGPGGRGALGRGT
jgi:hypothetical protein